MDMKKYIIAFFASVFSFISCGGNNANGDDGESGSLKSYGYSEHGSMAQPECEFTVNYVDDDNCQVIYFNHDNDDYSTNEERDTVITSASLLKDIEDVVVKHKMRKYKGHYSPMFDVLDGTSWGMDIIFQDETSVRSGGYMAWPDDDGCQIIKDMMRKQFKGI